MPFAVSGRHRLRNLLIAAGGVLAAFAATSPAAADSIDGQWCLGARHFEIEGPTITTPGGQRVTGIYSRHGFKYVVPAGEADAEIEIVMVLRSEELVQLTRGSAPEPETWRRCKPIS